MRGPRAMAILNEALSFDDIRYAISNRSDSVTGRHVSYDVEMSFHGRPAKCQLPAGTNLVRLDLPIVFGIFEGVWWIKSEVMERVLRDYGTNPASVRQYWQELLALPKPG